MGEKLVSMEQTSLLLQQILSSMTIYERAHLSKIGFSKKEQREMRHQLYRLIGFLRHKRGISVKIEKLDLRFDAKRDSRWHG